MAAETFVFNVAVKVLGMLGSPAFEEACLAWGVEKDLEKLKLTLSTVNAVLLDAEEQQAHNRELTVWLGNLKDVLSDAENDLDEFECESLRRQVVKTHGSTNRKVRRFFSSSNPLAFRFKMGHKLKEIRERFDGIASLKANFHLSERSPGSHVTHGRRETHSFVLASEIIGRDHDKEEIIQLLVHPDHQGQNVSILPIVGIGGLGKTTLAKLVLDDTRVKTHFQLRIWVCVSEDFVLKELLDKIIISITGEGYSGMNLEQSQIRLREKLDGRKFLLILDDVWNEEEEKWIEFKNFLMGGAYGSKILVTTRSQVVASITGTIPTYNLKGLPHDECLSLLVKQAFIEGQEQKYPNLVKIGDEIVKKCSGVPLAVKTLGGLLRSKTEERDWEFVRDNDIWRLKQEESDILPALQLSYNLMPSYLKQCFIYCSFFPKDYHYSSVNLILLWMAHGLLGSSNNDQDIGNQYIRELYSRSFFEDYIDAGYFQLFKVHDLVHDLALLVSQSECLLLNGSNQNVPKNVRHLVFSNVTWQNGDVFKQKSNTLRTILFWPNIGMKPITKAFVDACISRFKNLRVLDLGDSDLEVLPNSIGTMKNLRYLDLSWNCNIKKLPNSICKLQSLQSLFLDRCQALEELPKDIGSMISLRTLTITTKQMCSPVNGVGSMNSLQSLDFEKCNNLTSLFEGMQGPTTLRNLSIKSCGSLTSLLPALKCLTALEHLTIINCEKIELTEAEEKQDLRFSLRSIIIRRLPQLVSFPRWLQLSTNTLQFIGIYECPNLTALPEWLPDLASLRTLYITSCPNLLSLPEGMHHLTTLRLLTIYDCPELSSRCKSEIGEDWPKIAHVPDIRIDGGKIK